MLRISGFIIFLLLFSIAFSQKIQPTPAAMRFQSIENKRAMMKSTSIVTSFRNIGPTAMSGRVVDIDVNPNRPVEFYVAYATGGLWYTNNNGQSFLPLLDSADMLNLGDVTVHWPTGTIWIGTGEANASRSTYAGLGVYKSVDKGKTWQQMGLPESHHIGKILIHPTNPDIVWVAATGHLYTPNEERGIYKTTDGGITWKRVLYVNNMTGGIDMDLNPKNPNEIFACLWQKSRRAWNFDGGGSGSGIYKSTDGGQNWKQLNIKGSGLPTGDSMGRCGISIFEGDPRVLYLLVDNQARVVLPEQKDTATEKAKYQVRDFKKITREEFAALDDNKLDTFLKENRLAGRYSAKQVKEWVASGKILPNALYTYIIGDNEGGTIIGTELYRSDDGGSTWQKSKDKGLTNLYGPIGYYFGRVAVSPANANKVMVLGIQPMLSTDGGKSFKVISKANTHADYHAVWFNAADDNHIIVGNDGGINITYDNGANWFHANAPAVGQMYTVSLDNSRPYKVFAGLQDNGVWYGPSQQSGSMIDFADPKGFRRTLGGDGMMVAVDPRDNRTIYQGSQFGYYSRTHLDTGGYLSLRPQHELGDSAYRFNWLSPILLSRHLPDVFYIAGNKVHRSFDKGRMLKTISPDLTNGKKSGNVPYGTITALDESPLRFGLLYAGTDDGNLHLTKDGGGTWKKVDAKLPRGLWVSRVVASAFSEGRVYVTMNGYRDDHFNPYVYVSEDFGENWKPIHQGLPLECVNVIREDPWADSILYAGTDGGCYVSKDRGYTWQIWQKGLPVSVPVYDIAIHKGQNEIVLGTHGRSIYVASLNAINGVKGEIIQNQSRRRIEEEGEEF